MCDAAWCAPCTWAPLWWPCLLGALYQVFDLFTLSTYSTLEVAHFMRHINSRLTYTTFYFTRLTYLLTYLRTGANCSFCCSSYRVKYNCLPVCPPILPFAAQFRSRLRWMARNSEIWWGRDLSEGVRITIACIAANIATRQPQWDGYRPKMFEWFQ